MIAFYKTDMFFLKDGKKFLDDKKAYSLSNAIKNVDWKYVRKFLKRALSIEKQAILFIGIENIDSYKFMKLLYKGKMTKDLIPYWKEKFIKGCQEKVRHEHYEIELENGDKLSLPEYQIVKDINGNEMTIKQAIMNNVDIDENSLN
jgi:hypothetical protein